MPAVPIQYLVSDAVVLRVELDEHLLHVPLVQKQARRLEHGSELGQLQVTVAIDVEAPHDCPQVAALAELRHYLLQRCCQPLPGLPWGLVVARVFLRPAIASARLYGW